MYANSFDDVRVICDLNGPTELCLAYSLSPFFKSIFRNRKPDLGNELTQSRP